MLYAKRHSEYKGKAHGCIWQRSEEQQWAIWSIARDGYRRLAKEHHPDKGGTSDDFVEILSAWDKVRHCFAAHGFG